MTLREKTITHDTLTITVRERRGIDVWDEIIVNGKLLFVNDDAEVYRQNKFVEFVTRTVSVVGDLGFEWPTANGTREAVQAAYVAWHDLAPALMIAWANALYDINQAPLPTENVIAGNA